MRDFFRLNALPGPALGLIVGRGVGFLATFAVPLVLVRVFDQATFGTYKQLFLIYATLYGLAQLGVAESLYYFVPRRPAEAGRHAANAIGTLAIVGVVSAALLTAAAPTIARWLSNPELADVLPPLGLFLALMLMSAVFEIVLVAGQRYTHASFTYATSDIVRAAVLVGAADLELVVQVGPRRESGCADEADRLALPHPRSRANAAREPREVRVQGRDASAVANFHRVAIAAPAAG